MDGVGNVTRQNKQGVFVQIFFSQISDEGFSDPYKTSSRTGIVDSLEINAASLGEFRHGTIWEDGERIYSPPTAGTYTIDTDTSHSLFPSWSILIDGTRIECVPESYYALGRNRASLSASCFELVKVKNNKKTDWLIIPHSELLCFYIGQSERLLSAALDNSFDDYVDLNRSRVGEDGAPIIHLKRRISRLERYIFAKAVFDEKAKAALYKPHQHLSQALQHNKTCTFSKTLPLNVMAAFPFGGETKLEVSGKQIKLAEKTTGGREIWGVLVMKIDHCFRPIDFDLIRLTGDKQLGKPSPNTDEKASTQIPPAHRPEYQDPDDSFIDIIDQPADPSLPRGVSRNPANPFVGIEQIAVQRDFLDTQESSHRPIHGSGIAVTGFTDNKASADGLGSGIQGIGAFGSQHHGTARSLLTFIDMVQALKQIASANWKISTRLVGKGTSENEEKISYFLGTKNLRRTWHLVSTNETVRLRQVVFVEFQQQNQFVYLIEMEIRADIKEDQATLIFFQNDFSRIPDSSFRKLLYFTALRRRWPLHNSKWASKRHKERADSFLSSHTACGLDHISINAKNTDWAKAVLERLEKETKLSFSQPVEKKRAAA